MRTTVRWVKWLYYWPVSFITGIRHDYWMRRIDDSYARCVQSRRRLEWLLKQKRDD